MKILVAGATGSIGIHVVNTAIAMGHQPVALVRNRRKIKLLPRGTDRHEYTAVPGSLYCSRAVSSWYCKR